MVGARCDVESERLPSATIPLGRWADSESFSPTATLQHHRYGSESRHDHQSRVLNHSGRNLIVLPSPFAISSASNAFISSSLNFFTSRFARMRSGVALFPNGTVPLCTAQLCSNWPSPIPFFFASSTTLSSLSSVAPSTFWPAKGELQVSTMSCLAHHSRRAFWGSHG